MRTLSVRHPPAPRETVVRRPPAGPAEREFVDDVTLFCVALSPDAERLLLGLDETRSHPAVDAARGWRKVASTERHAALACRFGSGPDAVVRLQRLLEQTGPELKRTVVSQLPAWLRHVAEGVGPSAEPARGLRRALAARIVKEALQPPPSRAVHGPSGGPDGAPKRRQ